MPNNKKIKDFIFMDSERVRSYMAQLEGGIVENFTKKSTHEVDGKVEAAPGFISKSFVKGKLEGGYLYQRESSETLSLHHAMFDLLLDELENNKSISEDLSAGCSFIKVSANLKVMDYEEFANQIDAVAEASELIEKMTNIGVPPKAKSVTGQDKKNMKGIANTFRKLFGQAKILELINDDGETIATADLSMGLYGDKSLIFSKNNNVLPEKWTVVAIKQLPNPLKIKGQAASEFSQIIETATQAISQMEGILITQNESPVIIPIAIYREI